MVLLVLFLFSFQSIAAEAKEIPLKWGEIKGASSYKFEIAKNKEFSDIIFSKKVKGSEFNYQSKSGIYYLRVQAINEKGKGGKWSKPFKFVVTAPIAPSNEKSLSQKADFTDKPQNVTTSWTAPEETAPKYLMKVYKDGHKIQEKEVEATATHFAPTDAGNYEVTVQAGLDKYFGPPVTVQKIKLSKVGFASPRHPANEEKPNFSNKGEVQIKVPEVEGARSYKLVLYKLNPDNPKEKVAVMTKTVDSPKADFGKLPPGRYIASVESPEINSSSPLTEYPFNVRKAKAVEFEHIDLSFKYSYKQTNYNVSIAENNTYGNAKSVGGDLGFQGTMWFPSSDFGVRAEGHFGNVLINNSFLSINSVEVGSTYKTSWDLIKTEFTFFLGGRLWTMPVLVNSNMGNNNNVTQVYSPTIIGPFWGFDWLKPLSSKWSLIGSFEFSQPVTYTQFASTNYFQTPIFDPNAKISLGARYAYNEHMGIVGTVGMQSDSISYFPSNSNISSQSNFNSRTRIETDDFVVGVGVEFNDENSNFTDNPKAREKFSEIDFTTRYRLAPLSYTENLAEMGSAAPFTDYSASTLELSATGFFKDSHHGFNLQASWGGYNYQGTTIGYPEFLGGWGYRLYTNKKPRFQVKNFLGARAWQIPIIQLGGGSGAPSFSSLNTELIGADENVHVTYRFADAWAARAKFEVSMPLIMANRSSNITSLSPSAMSAKASLDITREFSDEFSASLEYGVRGDQLRYTASGFSEANSSSVSINSAGVGLGITYSF